MQDISHGIRCGELLELSFKVGLRDYGLLSAAPSLDIGVMLFPFD
jgi:hypothetical protein